MLLLQTIFLSSLIGVNASGDRVQLSIQDACRFAREANEIVSEMQQALFYQRELAIRSADGSIGNIERGFLDDHYEALQEYVLTLASTPRFMDQYWTTYSYMAEGFQFETDVQLLDGSSTYKKSFDFNSMHPSILGRLYTYEIQPMHMAEFWEYGFLEVNGSALPATSDFDDALSIDGNKYSGIAVGTVFNRIANSTGVFAIVQDTTLKLEQGDFHLGDGAIHQGELSINGVEIVGNAHNLYEAASRINEFSSSTGIKARLIETNPTAVELYSTDGRNISVVGEHFEAFATASVILESTAPFSLRPNSIYGIGMEPVEVHEATSNYEASDISRVATAQDALPLVDSAIAQTSENRVKLDIIRRFCR